jgi:hypothetical protein
VRNLRPHYAVLGAALLLSACASRANRASTRLDSAPVSLTVTNQNWLDVDVFVIRGTTRYRLGAVGGNSSATLSIPTSLIVHGQLQLMADPIGSDDVYVTEMITVAPDETVQLTVAPRMRMSSYAVSTRW